MTYILSGARTPVGSFLGSLSQIPAPKLGAMAIRGALKKTSLSSSLIDEVFMGHVILAGTGQAPARQAALHAGLPEHIPCTTINKVCGSGLKTIIMGHQTIQAGDNRLVISGGMENMSLAPHLIMETRAGIKFGEVPLRDSMQWDGLRDASSDKSMGDCGEECAEKYNISRQEQDKFAIESFKKAQKASKDGLFQHEIVPVTTKDGVIKEDEGPFKVKFDRISSLKPAFKEGGTITAANASSVNDGGAALVLAGEEYKKQARFRIIAHSQHAQNPSWFTTAPIPCIEKLLTKTKIKIEDIDLFEINEAFSVVTLVTMRELAIQPSKVNIYGGGVSLGHPIGCSGTRIVITLMNALERTKKKLGLACLCIGGGEALAILIENLDS